MGVDSVQRSTFSAVVWVMGPAEGYGVWSGGGGKDTDRVDRVMVCEF